MIDIDAAFREEFFDVAVRQAAAEVAAHRQQDHVRREPEAGGSSGLGVATTDHPRRLAADNRSVNATVPRRFRPLNADDMSPEIAGSADRSTPTLIGTARVSGGVVAENAEGFGGGGSRHLES